jgi:hypothetical protein
MHTLLDKVLVGPSPAELEAEALAALAAVNGEHRPRRPLTDSSVRAGLRSVADLPEGQRQWLGRPGAVSAAVGVAWWRDFSDRLHVRVVGAHLSGPDRCADGLFGPVVFPPLALVYPERALVRPAPTGGEVLCLCACGAWGEARSLGWMGDRCGPCHDRGPDAPRPPAAGLDVGPDARDVAVSPAGSLLAAIDGGGLVRTWAVADGTPRGAARTDVGGGVGGLALSPDGRMVAVARSAAGWSIDLWGLGGVCLARLPASSPCCAFTPDGPALTLVRGGAPALVRVPFAAPDPVLAFSRADGGSARVTLSPDGRRLAAAWRRLTWWEVPLPAVAGAVELPGEALSPPAFAADGRPAAVVAAPRRDEALLAGPAGAIRLPWPAGDKIDRLSFAPDGRHLAALGARLLRVWERHGAGWRVLLDGHGDGARRLEWLPDGRLLTFSPRDGAVKLWPAGLFTS